MRFLIDAQLPPALARWISERQHDALHVSDVGLLAASDVDIWQYALERKYVVVSKDEDFAVRSQRNSGVQVLWIRRGIVPPGRFFCGLNRYLVRLFQP